MIKTLSVQQEKREGIKKQLNSFQWAKLELEGKRYLWLDLLNNTYGVKATVYTGMPSRREPGNPTAITAEQVEKIQGYIRELEAMLEKQMQVFNSLIEPLDPDGKAILTWRYISGVSWDKMELHIHYSRRQCIRIHDAAIDKIIMERKN